MDGGIVVTITAKEIRVATDGEPTPSWVPADLYPFASHFEDINGSRVHYLDEGVGPPLTLLHGNPTWSFLYRDVIAGLRGRYRCIAVDYPGFVCRRRRPATDSRPPNTREWSRI
jgi:haloalkane dehalogenase